MFPNAEKIHIGTSGFSYPDWVGTAYPEGTRKQEMLEVYATLLKTVEINSTYYTIPSAKSVESMVNRTGADFKFTVKLPGELTHTRENVAETAGRFLAVLEPMIEAGKLAAFVCQFPWAFQKSPGNMEYIQAIAGLLGEAAPLVVEFRHNSWICDNVFAFLEKEQIAYCAVDEPDLPGLLPPILKVTAPISYIRFHSRDGSKWWATGGKQRYNYLYSVSEINEWLPAVRQAADQSEGVFIFFNNCHLGNAAKNARMLLELLGLLDQEASFTIPGGLF